MIAPDASFDRGAPHSDANRTWRVTSAATRTPLLALVCVIVILAVAETVARVPLVQSCLPAPGLGSRSRLLEVQWDNLRRAAARHGGIDCIAIGNSLTLFGFDPDSFSAGFARRTGYRPRCFNFGIFGLTASGVGALAPILAAEYHPWLIIYGSTPRDLTWNAGDPAVADMPWVQYRLGRVSVDGWLTEHSAAYRYYLMYLSWHQFVGRPLPPLSISADGFLSTDFTMPDRAAKYALFQQLANRAFTPPIAPDQRQGVRDFLAVRGPQLLMVDMPAHPALRPLLEATASYRPALRAMQVLAHAHHTSLWHKSSWAMIPETDWADFWHLNRRGARIFSRWVGERTALAVVAGRLARPPMR